MKPSILTLLYSCVALSLYAEPPPSPPRKAYPYGVKKAPQPPLPPPPAPAEGRTIANDSASFRIGLFHKEANGIGYDQGYTSLTGFFTFDSLENWHPFFDVRAHLFNDGKPAGNMGFGIRYMPDTLPLVLGINGFFDIKSTRHTTFEQVGVGIELLGTKWEGRVNGYLPIFQKNELSSIGFSAFKGHHAIFAAHHHIAFTGCDASISRILTRKKLWDLSMTVDGYAFFADYNSKAVGGLGKFTSHITPYFAIETQGSYDSYFKGILQVQASFQVPFGKQIKTRTTGMKKGQARALALRLAESVDRFEMIVSSSHSIESIGEDPRTQTPLHIVFVDNTKTQGDGSFEAPYSSLSEAEDASHIGDMIYVFSGDHTSTHMNTGIVLQNSQWLQGSATAFILNSSFGPCGVPPMTNQRPTIENTAGDAITLASDNQIVGFAIHATESGITGSHITNLLVKDNLLLFNATRDITLLSTNGAISLYNNEFHSPSGVTIVSAGPVTMDISNNSFHNTSSNLGIDIAFGTSNTLLLANNTLTGTALGATILARGSSITTLECLHNTLTSLAPGTEAALHIEVLATAQVEGLLQNNAFTADGKGLEITTSMSASSSWLCLHNTGTDTSSSLFPFTFTTEDSALSSLVLLDNYANSSGYELTNIGTSSVFTVASTTSSLQGLQNQNTGNFQVSGPITYVPLSSFLLPE